MCHKMVVPIEQGVFDQHKKVKHDAEPQTANDDQKSNGQVNVVIETKGRFVKIIA